MGNTLPAHKDTGNLIYLCFCHSVVQSNGIVHSSKIARVLFNQSEQETGCG